MSVRGAGLRQTRSDAFPNGVQGPPSLPRGLRQKRALRAAKGRCHRPSTVAVGRPKMNCTVLEWKGAELRVHRRLRSCKQLLACFAPCFNMVKNYRQICLVRPPAWKYCGVPRLKFCRQLRRTVLGGYPRAPIRPLLLLLAHFSDLYVVDLPLTVLLGTASQQLNESM